MEVAREWGYLLHKKDCVQVYLDLAPEALDKKRELQELGWRLWSFTDYWASYTNVDWQDVSEEKIKPASWFTWQILEKTQRLRKMRVDQWLPACTFWLRNCGIWIKGTWVYYCINCSFGYGQGKLIWHHSMGGGMEGGPICTPNWSSIFLERGGGAVGRSSPNPL